MKELRYISNISNNYFKYSARFIPHLGRRKAVHGIWFLVLIAYVYTADTCLNLLRCVQVNVLKPAAGEFNGTSETRV